MKFGTTLTFLLTFACLPLAHAQNPVPLFNGKDLTGWTGADYEVKDGVLICKGKILRTEKEYSNYIFEFDFLLPPHGNNGLGIHYPGTGNPSASGMELQILDNSDPKYAQLVDSQYHGSLYKLQAAKRGFLKPVGEWNHQKVTVNGPQVIVELNGTVINDANLDELAKSHVKHQGVKRRSGHIALCGHGSPVQFKNITLVDLTAKPAKPAPKTSQTKSSAFPDRETFAAHPRELSQVPVSAFQLPEALAGKLKIEVWAQSPRIFTPVAMDIDAQGRIWATEGIDYSTEKRIDAGQSIVVLADTDLDGKADHSHVFVTEKDMRRAPLGIAVFDNRIVVSATPSITVYTDVDRNAVFDPAVDKKETFLTGFAGAGHDHTLHAVIGSPSGQWYFSYGNMGADIKTIDGRHFLSGCYYGSSELIGKPSSDGHLYVGGVAMRVNPDGTGLSAVGHNMRNPHDMFVSSTGDVFQSDNDDPAHCRATWLMEYGNMGYSDLRDGSRSWEEAAKSWEEPEDGDHIKRRSSKSHWRENYPGATPPGTVYGAGSPTGNVFIEGDELGEDLRGLYLHCDMVRKEVMGYTPKDREAHIEMGPHHAFIGLKEDSKKEHFLPTDLVLGLDGALYFSDFHNDTSRRTNLVTGTIYRISRSDEKQVTRPTIDFTTPGGLVRALQSPAINVRSEAVIRLIPHGEKVSPALIELFEETSNPYIQARCLWVLAQLGPKGLRFVESLLDSNDTQHRLVAFRAMRFADPENILALAGKMASDPSPALRREVALSLRDQPFDACREILLSLIDSYKGENRWALEAFGIAATGKEREVYQQLIQPSLDNIPHAQWDQRAINLAWRLHTPEAIDDLDQVIRAQEPGLEQFRHLAMAFASFRDTTQRDDQKTRLQAIALLPAFAEPDFQITVDEIIARDLNDLQGEHLTASYVIPKSFGATTKLSDVDTIAALKGDAAAGKAKAQLCLVCHKLEGQGAPFGPNLTQWGQTRTIDQIVSELLDPSAHLAHGYDTPVRLTAGKNIAEGLLSNYSFHAGSLKIKLFGGQTKKILFRKSGAKVERLENHSWMPPASDMGLSDQDVRDIAEYLNTL
jgi:putative membrane-bound dehydrogenase-like protein